MARMGGKNEAGGSKMFMEVTRAVWSDAPAMKLYIKKARNKRSRRLAKQQAADF